MPKDDAALPRYLAEWFVQPLGERTIDDIALRLRRSVAAMPVPIDRPALLYAVFVPLENYAFMVFTADSANAVARACEEAGFPADRVTAALEAPCPTDFAVPVGRSHSADSGVR